MEMMVPVSVGEVADKISILKIKAERITDLSKLRNIHVELEALCGEFDRQLPAPDEALLAELARLKAVNEKLWDIEDDIRECEKRHDFGAEFIALARAVYVTNDERARVKKVINTLTGSRLVEEKSYAGQL